MQSGSFEGKRGESLERLKPSRPYTQQSDTVPTSGPIEPSSTPAPASSADSTRQLRFDPACYAAQVQGEDDETMSSARQRSASQPAASSSRAPVPPTRLVNGTSTPLPMGNGVTSPCFVHNHLDQSLATLSKAECEERKRRRKLLKRAQSSQGSLGSASVDRGGPTDAAVTTSHVDTSGRQIHPAALATRIGSPETSPIALDPDAPRVISDGQVNGRPRASSRIRDARETIETINHRLDKADLIDTGSSEQDAQDDDDDDDDEEEEDGQSLTRQLAETAVSVREISRQLGRASVKPNIQSIMIITKARDNHLIKLTRELAIYLMGSTKEGDERGATVYVDAQLRKSSRFDAAGIEADHPEFFRAVQTRRISRTSSMSSSVSSLPTLAGFNEKQHARRSSAANGLRMTSSKSAAAKTDTTEAENNGQLRYWTSDMCNKSPHLFDFVITLGGDGTVLFASWLFQRIVPPVIPFALGSLGFLTNFDFSDHEKVMTNAINNGVRVNLRMRFTCTVYRAVDPPKDPKQRRRAIRSGETGAISATLSKEGGWSALESAGPRQDKEESEKAKDREIMCFSARPAETFEVLNDLVVDRGPSPYVSLLELFGDEHHMTTVQADGLCVSTPTGSTAYSLSAGGSLVHPEIPAILISPICPHTLSFRPMLLPDSMELRICVPYNSRSTAWASFDGRGRVELRQGDHIKVTASQYPFPTVCADKQSTDWFHAIGRTLKWNERQRQKSFVVVEESRRKPTTPAESKQTAEQGSQYAEKSDTQKPKNGDESEDEEGGGSDYDIDDISSSSSSAKTSPAPITPGAHSADTVKSTSQSGRRGDRDDIRDPVDPKLTTLRKVKAHELRGKVLTQEATSEPSTPGQARAFAVYGQDDQSDGSQSDLEI
ncbi:uncharacterized protein L969DRAFT_80409 [Mixia osmundae IAM 14324]|uniref:NAD+ kinase n=1 Tax=Mixia osmundae (strain CBS 9802 / IAM 14324 / JCM 22182 / KY 12970) TaxID=764103 RepID=G7E4H6_MIXOS|nr:uncharacterized protein L969DRAFT_80409 [Mixia osmundae IAM 14324]KEI36248.1 hypothetical protein L969DRAFT_80409 [Mixia osmundae IAM 14324]GAA97736.1 hypothetical protein E5Q_04415 [Mixia osmundae IAM 14324]